LNFTTKFEVKSVNVTDLFKNDRNKTVKTEYVLPTAKPSVYIKSID